MHFKTKKATYKIVSVDSVNVNAYDVETKKDIIVDINEFNMWVGKGQVQMIDLNVIDNRFKIPRT